jgi:predicted RNA-binding protein with EMAP domain
MQSTHEVSHDVSCDLTFKGDKKRVLFDCQKAISSTCQISATKVHFSRLRYADLMPHSGTDTEIFRKPMSDIQSVVITVNGNAKRYSAEFQTSADYERSWQKVLKEAYGHADVRCLCRGAGAKRLAVNTMSSETLTHWRNSV